MPPSADNPCLVDTSVAVPFLVEDHDHHASTFEALHVREMGLAGHAAFETFSVLTRLPSSSRQTPETAGRLLAANFPLTRFLGPERAANLFAQLSQYGIAGGSVYDALVGASALEHGLSLATRDPRALAVYRDLGVQVEVLP